MASSYRFDGQYQRMPAVIWFAMFGLTILAMFIGGYEAGLAGGHLSTTAVVVPALAFSVVLLLIVALERPVQELTPVNQAPLIDVQEDIHRSLESP